MKKVIKKVLKSISGILSRENNKQVLIFMLFMLISVLFWILQSLNDKEDVTVDIPLTYVNVPKNMIFTEEPPSSVSVVLRDKGVNLINYSLNRANPVIIDFENYEKKHGRMVISHSQILSAVHNELKPSSELVALHSDSIVLLFAQKTGNLMNVRLDADISVASNYIQTQQPTISPNTVNVYADSHILSSMDYIETEKLYLSELTDTTVVSVKLKSINGVKVVPETITVTVPVEELINKKLSLPIKAVNFPKSLSLITFPATADLEFFVPLSRFLEADTSKFAVVVDYMQLNLKHTNKLPINLAKHPTYARYLNISPDSVEYIIEHNQQ